MASSPITHWKDWCWSWSSNTLPTRCKESTHWKRPWCWERLKQKRVEEDEMVGWHHWLNGHESEQTPGDSEGRGAWCAAVRGIAKSKELDMTSVQFSSVAQSCLTLCGPMNHSMPGLPVHHQLLEFTQTQVHRVGDAIQPYHPLSSPSLPALNPSQYQSLSQWVNLFAWGGQSTGVSALASFLPKKSQGWSPSEWSLLGLF